MEYPIKKLDRAKLGLMKHKASLFMCSIAFNMYHEFDEDTKTANVDGIKIRYNPKFFEACPKEQRVTMLYHEAAHVALQHLTRVGKRDPDRFNDAGDYVINQLAKDSGLKPIIFDRNGIKFKWLQDDRFRDMSTVQVYNILKKEGNPTSGDSDITYPIPDSKVKKKNNSGKDSEKQTPLTKKQVDTSIKSIIMRAYTQTKMSDKSCGSVPSEILKEIEKLINPILNWRDILNRFLNEKTKEDYSWQRPNKRFMPDFYLPSLYSETIPTLTFAIDTSGSVSDEDLQCILSEIEFIRDTFKPQKITILDCDTQINNIHEVTPDMNILDLKFSGGGGTDAYPVFKYCDDNPTIGLIYFTDLYLRTYQGNPNYEVLWIVYDNPTAKVDVGEITHYKL